MKNQKDNEIVDSENFLKQKFKSEHSSLCGNVFIKKAQKNFVIKFGIETFGSKMHKIELFDENKPFDSASYIKYQIHKDGIFICYFQTDFNYQGLGLGKYVYQLAQAHADLLKLTHSEGLISPIGRIKGVDTDSDYHAEKEMDFLLLLYHALGNKIDKIEDHEFSMYVFSDKWEQGQKYAKLNDEQKDFVENIVEYEKELDKKSTKNESDNLKK